MKRVGIGALADLHNGYSNLSGRVKACCLPSHSLQMPLAIRPDAKPHLVFLNAHGKL